MKWVVYLRRHVLLPQGVRHAFKSHAFKSIIYQGFHLFKMGGLFPPCCTSTYIQALAGVLQKAESRDFVIEMVGFEEQLQLQKALGLGREQQDTQTLVNAWVQQIGDGSAELDALLQLQTRKRDQYLPRYYWQTKLTALLQKPKRRF